MKTARFIASIAVLVFSVNLAFAQTPTDVQVQEGVGGGSGDTSSASYQAKTASADPGVGTSQSANYLYDHGTLWFDDLPVSGLPPPPPDDVIPPSVPINGGGNSGSGWLTGLFGGNTEPGVGGISPEADVPFTDTPEAAAVVAEVPTATYSAVKQVDAPTVLNRILEDPRPVPQIIRLVDEKGVTRELNIVLFKRIVPWPLWIAFAIILLGAAAIAGFVIMRGMKDYLLWIGGMLVLTGVVMGIVVRFAYRAVPIDPTVITSIGVVPVAEANATVKKLMVDLPLGVHVVSATDSLGKKALTVKVFITPALPI